MAKNDARDLLRRAYFLNERTRYVTVGFLPSENYQVLVDFGGPRIVPLRLAKHHVRTMIETLPELCDAMQCEIYTRKDGALRIRSCRNHNCARLYHGRQCVSIKLADLRYTPTMLQTVVAQQCHYILGQAHVMSYAYGFLGSLVFAEPQRSRDSDSEQSAVCGNLSYSSYRSSAGDTHVISNVSMPSTVCWSRYITTLMVLCTLFVVSINVVSCCLSRFLSFVPDITLRRIDSD